MKKILSIMVLLILVSSCSNNDDNDSNCNFLLNVGVNLSINLNLPEYNDLNFVSQPVYIGGQGNLGIIVTNTGSGYVAYDAADPNHNQTSCSVLDIVGLEGVCGCDDANKYSLFTGQPLENGDLRCGLKAYRTEINGNNVIVTN